MNFAMISITPDNLTHLLSLRSTGDESLDDVLRRVLPQKKDSACPPPSAHTESATNIDSSKLHYCLKGEQHNAQDATEAMIAILRYLAHDANFFETLATKIRGRTRNHLARSRAEVYPQRPDLARYVKQVSPGWFVGCNIANREKANILRAACNVAGLTFGRDLKIDLANT